MNSQILTFDIGTSQSLRKIFTAVLACPDNIENESMKATKMNIYNKCIGRFFMRFPINIFFNEYYFIYQVIKESKVRLFTIQQLISLIYSNSNEILSTPFIDLSQVSASTTGNTVDPQEKIQAFISDMCDIVTDLSNTLVSEEEFDSACAQYLSAYKTRMVSQTYATCSMIMSETGFDEPLKRGASRHLQGIDDANKYLNNKMAQLKALDEENATRYIEINNEYAERENVKDASGEEDTQALMDYGIAEMDEYCIKMRRGHMVEMMGPPKGGKTTFTGYLVERALSKGLNVCIWPLEGKYTEWMALIETLTVAHWDKDKMQLNRGKVLNREFKTDAERQAIAAARQLIASPERGKLTFIESTAYIEDFLETLKDHYNNVNAFDVVVIDSPVNIMSKYGKGKVERISEGYMMLKDFVANQIGNGGVLCLVTAQLKQDAIDKLRARPNETIDVTAGGESAETIRTPDEVIGLFSTKIERSSGQMKIYSVASRHHEAFQDFFVGCNLGSGDFYSKPELNE